MLWQCRGAAAAVIVFDITNTESLAKAKNWVKELQRQGNPNMIMALAGNKADLVEARAVTSEEAQVNCTLVTSLQNFRCTAHLLICIPLGLSIGGYRNAKHACGTWVSSLHFSFFCFLPALQAVTHCPLSVLIKCSLLPALLKSMFKAV